MGGSSGGEASGGRGAFAAGCSNAFWRKMLEEKVPDKLQPQRVAVLVRSPLSPGSPNFL